MFQATLALGDGEQFVVIYTLRVKDIAAFFSKAPDHAC
jgi:hypothetical protein